MSLAGIFIHLEPERRRNIVERIDRFAENQISIDGMVLLMQDLLDTGALPYLPHHYTAAAIHCVQMGLCTVHGRMLQ